MLEQDTAAALRLGRFAPTAGSRGRPKRETNFRNTEVRALKEFTLFTITFFFFFQDYALYYVKMCQTKQRDWNLLQHK